MNRSYLVSVVGVLAATGMASAQLDTSDPYLYGAGRSYQASSPMHFATPAGFFDIFTELDMLGSPIGPPPPGGSEVRESPTRPRLHASLNGLPPGEPWVGSLSPMVILTSSSGGGTFDTEMLSMNLQGGTMPPGVMIRESPTRQSLGQTHVTPIGGGMFRIHSFFDVFAELSIDGGQTWMPAEGAPTRVQLTPAPGAAVLLGLGGLFACRRRR